MLTEAWTQLRFHTIQNRLWRTQAKIAVVVAGRGSGKTELARRRVIRYLPVKKPWKDPMYFYALPVRDQAKRVAWGPLKNLLPPSWIHKIYESDLIIKTVFGSELHLLGMDKPHRAEGVQWDGGVVDESSDQKPGIIDVNLGPAMTHRDPWLWRIGVPKRFGVGAKNFRKAFETAQVCNDGLAEAFWWKSGDIIEPDVLERRRETLDEIDFAEQYEASWEKAGGLVFHAFSKANVLETYYNPNEPLIIGQDFNVNPMSWILCHKREERLEVFDEIWMRNTNTQATLDKLWQKYGNGHNAAWVFVGDAAGRARHTNADRTDYLLVRNDERFAPKRVLYPRSNPRVLSRFASCNALLKNARGRMRCFIHPRCKHLIDDLNARAYKEGTRVPDDGAGDISHMSDAWGYVVHQLFPIPLTTPGVVGVFTDGD